MAGGEYFAIASEKQFAAYEEYLKKAEGPAVGSNPKHIQQQGDEIAAKGT